MSNKGGLALAAVVSATLCGCGAAPDETKPASVSVAVADSAPPPPPKTDPVVEHYLCMVGQDAVVKNPTNKVGAPCATSAEDLMLAVNAGDNGDHEGLTSLELQGKILVLKNGTKVHVERIDNKVFYKVRVLSGSYIGQDLWTPVFCVDNGGK